MTLSSGFHMPGAFHTDGIHQGLFRPPGSPASSSGYLPPTRSSVEAPNPKRKRFRDHVRQFEQKKETNNASTVLITPAGRHVAQNGRAYTLAGQLDTPTSGGLADGEPLEDSMYSDEDYRKALGSKRCRDDVDAAEASGPSLVFDLPHHPHYQSPGWSTVAFSTIGGVVGKVWEFCKVGAFKGFYAGGGRGFEMPPGEGVLPEGSTQHHHHRIPGYFPEGECCNDQDAAGKLYMLGGASTPSAPAVKRRQTAPMDDLGRNWVMVKGQDQVGDSSGNATPRRTSSSYRSSPRNRNQGPSAVTGRRISAPNQRRVSGKFSSPAPYRASPRNSGINTISPPCTFEPPRPASCASFASPRSLSPTKASSMASSTNVASTASPTPATSRGHNRRQTFTHSRTHSSASTASSRGAADDVDNSPRLNVEARQLAAQRQREERDTDVRIAAFNKQLQDMIRQGKEALGTTIEVDGEDGGWEEY
ncbi:hypothetical protein EsDP_00001494 [Epichloe bromicola]|uniref:Uncharacterized protein n=1 Tax=Epichloe bromicola TaxID=79588 RepID=A0ABQ0CI08_9HYPO